MKTKQIFIYLLVCFFAIVPFFWLKSNLINIGGDSSGAYFYNPFAFIKNYAVYSINPWNVNSEITGFFLIPFSGFLGIILFFVNSPHNLINFFNSLMLTIGFTAMYGCIYSLLSYSDNKLEKGYARTAAVIGSLFYVFSPNMTNWDKPLITFTHFMLDPLIFFLIYKYLRTQKIIYGIVILLTTFIFAHNFSFIGAPTFFSFYPFVFLYFFLSHFFVKKNPINLIHIFLFFLIFIGIHAFQIVPQIMLVFSPDSVLAERVFSQKTFNYVNYFYRIANGVTVVDNFLGISQSSVPNASTYFIFPLLIILSLFQRVKNGADSLLRKNYIIFLFIFLLLLFFTSAKFTQLGLWLYASLFKIPGFGMFRHFTGQFMTSYIFFYSIVIGFAIYTLSRNIHKKIIFYLTIVIAFILFNRGLPLLNGNMLYLPVLQTKITTPFQMPEAFDKAIQYISDIKTDSKILSFPVNDFGYLLFSGEKDGLYIGTSLIGPFTLKSDFQTPEDLGPYAKQFLRAVYTKNIPVIVNLLAYLNIHDIFWEKNPKIYSTNFPDFPYSSTKLYIPTTVSFYQSFIRLLPIINSKSFGNSLHVLHIRDDYTLPSIYVSGKPVYSNNIFDTINIPFKNGNQPSAVLSYDSYYSGIKYSSFQADYSNQFAAFDDNLQFHSAEPEASWKPGSVVFPLILKKEQLTLSKLQGTEKLNMSYLFLAKRIVELKKWGKDMPIHTSQSRLFWDKYNSWESQFSIYNLYASTLIDLISKYPANEKNAQKMTAEEQFEQHRIRLYTLINTIDFSQNEKKSLILSNNALFDNLVKKLEVQKADLQKHYSLKLPKGSKGIYNIELSRVSWPSVYSKVKINEKEFNGTILPNGEITFGSMQISSEKEYTIQLDTDIPNLGEKYPFEGNQKLLTSGNINHITFSKGEDGAFEPVIRNLPLLTNANQYLLSFKIKTEDTPFYIRLFNNSINNDGLLEKRDFSKRIVKSTEWKMYQTVFTVAPEMKSAGIEFTPGLKEGSGRLEIKDFTLTPIEHPLLIFQDTKEISNKLPKITYQRINPVKYKINIENATESYILTFLKAYNTKWKLYYAGTNFDPIKVDKSYFDGLISEGDHKNILLDKNTFKTWSMPEIASHNHWIANGYANAWIINPKDTPSRNYELILEFTAQRQFYIGSLITVITVIIILVILLFIIINMMINLKR